MIPHGSLLSKDVPNKRGGTSSVTIRNPSGIIQEEILRPGFLEALMDPFLVGTLEPDYKQTVKCGSVHESRSWREHPGTGSKVLWDVPVPAGVCLPARCDSFSVLVAYMY